MTNVWLPAPTDLTLLRDDVHIWRIDLDRPEFEMQHLAATLSQDEVARAERFYFEQHRQRFIAGRGILRCILGRYLGIQPQQVEFSYQFRGKPVLADTLAASKLSFNLSHSQGLAVCAVNCHRSIGIDLEYIRLIADVETLAKRFFAVREYDLVRSLPTSQQQEVFFRYWTCKEAYLKATGAGLVQLEQIEVFLTPGEPAKLNLDEEWSLLELVPYSNYVAAVAVEGFGCYLKCWQY